MPNDPSRSNQLDLEQVRRDLTTELEEIDSEIATLTKPPETGAALAFGKRIGEGTSEAISRFTDVGTANNLQAIKLRIERALLKLDEGSYGTCDNCGAEIPAGRLQAAPSSALCIECARAAR